MPQVLGLSLTEAIKHLPEGAAAPRICETAARCGNREKRTDGTLRVVAVRGDEWIVARFLDAAPAKKEEA